MWIQTKRGFFVNAYHLYNIDILPAPADEENSGVFEVIGEGGFSDARPVLLFWGTLEDCMKYMERLQTILSVRLIELQAISDKLNNIEPKL